MILLSGSITGCGSETVRFQIWLAALVGSHEGEGLYLERLEKLNFLLKIIDSSHGLFVCVLPVKAY